MKRIVVLIVLLILASIIAGCGGDEVASTNGNQETVTSVEPAPAANIAVSAQMPTQLSEQEIINAMPQGCVGWLEEYAATPMYLCRGQAYDIQLMRKTPLVKAPLGSIVFDKIEANDPYLTIVTTQWEDNIRIRAGFEVNSTGNFHMNVK